MEKICLHGHVIDPGKEVCSRCNAPAIGEKQIEATVEETIAKKEVSKKKKVVKKDVKKKK